MKVLYVSEAIQMSGGEHSLLTLLDALAGQVNPVVACPDGHLAAAVAARGIERRRIGGIDLSFRLHPRHTSSGLLALARGAAAVDRLARRERPDVIHANATRSGLASQLAGHRRAPLVVSVRDAFGEGRLGAAARRVLASGAAALVANSDFVRADFADVEDSVQLVTVHNAVDVKRFSPERYDRARSRAALGFAADVPLLGVVGQITPWKGQIDAVEALAAIREQLPQAELAIAGSPKFATAATRLDNRGYDRRLRARSRELGLAKAVHFLGERNDVPVVMAALDVLLVPSWWEPFGRVAIEAMAMGVPVIGTAVGGITEVISDGVDGLLVEPRRPDLWAAAALELLRDPEQRVRLAVAGRDRVAAAFTPRHHAELMWELYEHVSC